MPYPVWKWLPYGSAQALYFFLKQMDSLSYMVSLWYDYQLKLNIYAKEKKKSSQWITIWWAKFKSKHSATNIR